MTVQFNTTDEERRVIAIIRDRAEAIALSHNIDLDPCDLEMDITACHCNGCPLELERLLAADNANFGHDVFGIRRFIDRTTGTLTECFLPRHAVKE